MGAADTPMPVAPLLEPPVAPELPASPEEAVPEPLTAADLLAWAVSSVHRRVTIIRAWLHRLRPVPEDRHRSDRCPFCRHELGLSESRPPRDIRNPRGRMARLPAELLTWRRCTGCGLHQVGVRAGGVS